MSSLVPRHVFRIGALLWTSIAGLATEEISPIPAGPYAVGSSHLEITASPTSPLIDYLKGKSTRTGSLYLADLLVHPDAALLTQVKIPADHALHGRHAGSRMPLLLYVLYPTTSENLRSDYRFPYPDTADNVFPHMQQAGDKPLFPRDATRHPLIVFSHGYEGHGLWDLDHLKFLAAQGYIVASIFHGDGRDGFETGLARRPLELKQALDYLLAHPYFGPAIDPDRIGVSGSSFGGYTILAAMGAKNSRWPTAVADPRIKAGFGLVPFLGARLGPWLLGIDAWPFGKDFAGLRAVQAPFFAVYGEKDTNVRPAAVRAGVAQMSGATAAVMLDGEQHLLSKHAWSDVHTWEVLFFDTWLRGDAKARKQLYGASSVRGGVHDHKTFQRAPRISAAATALVPQ